MCHHPQLTGLFGFSASKQIPSDSPLWASELCSWLVPVCNLSHTALHSVGTSFPRSLWLLWQQDGKNYIHYFPWMGLGPQRAQTLMLDQQGIF